MSFSEQLINWLHLLPHLNYRLHLVRDPFNIDINGPYVQSLVVFCALSLIVALFFLLGIVTIWIGQCCQRKSEQVHSRRHIRRLSTMLFFNSIICFFLLAVCLYCNEHTNKSFNAANAALAGFNQNLRSSADQTRKLNSTQFDIEERLGELTSIIEQKSKHTLDINQTLLRETDDLLTKMSDKLDKVKDVLKSIRQLFVDEKFLERLSSFGSRLEFERWILCLTLVSIIIVVIFLGVVAFCCRSRIGSVFFSGLGIVIFIVSWLIFSLIFPLTVAYADFCANGQPFLRSRINEVVLETFNFYKNCASNSVMRNAVPPSVPLHELNKVVTNVQEDQQKLEVLLYSLFNYSEEVSKTSRLVVENISRSFKSIGALESALSCSAVNNNVATMYYEFCEWGFLGFAIMAISLFFLGIFLFSLLILVSKSWNVFVNRPADYVEVGEDDHFSPRGQEMPESVYDTNVYNPRARNLNNGVVDTNGSILNNASSGSSQTNPNFASSPLLMNGDATTALTDTWLRNGGGIGNLASAPPATNTLGTTNRNSINYYRLSNNGGYRSHYQQPAPAEFQEQYNV